jgi:hypothetical protein
MQMRMHNKDGDTLRMTMTQLLDRLQLELLPIHLATIP